MISDAQFHGVHSLLDSEGGFTVNPRTGESITSGISVAPRNNEQKMHSSESSPEALKKYHGSNTAAWTDEKNASGKVIAPHNASLGGWRSEDSDFFDTPTVHPNTPGGETRARRQMTVSGQEAGFKLDDFQEVFNPFNAEGRRKMNMAPHEIADIASRGQSGSDFAMRQPEVQAWIGAPAGRGAALRSARGLARGTSR